MSLVINLQKSKSIQIVKLCVCLSWSKTSAGWFPKEWQKQTILLLINVETETMTLKGNLKPKRDDGPKMKVNHSMLD